MARYTMKSKVRDVYQSPIGRDIIDKLLLQMNVSENVIKNPIAMRLTLSMLCKLAGKKIGRDFWDAVLGLLNNEAEAIDAQTPDEGPPTKKWWKESIFYQIYPRSFYDSNGDGIGDIPGITAKLDYLKDLGVDAIWLCPVYDSPQDDNGYDIRDYMAIDKTFGTMEDFDRLLFETHKRGMKLIMDLVVNHTSDEHEWFREAVANPDSKYRDYYFFRARPNNWLSFFGGPAWKHVNENEFALCLFSKKQMDLNWDNRETRDDVYKIIRWWLDKGVDGFRLDVINLISKTPGLPDGNEFIGSLMRFRGIEHYFYGPKLHDYLSEMRREAFEPYDAFTVGEMPGIGMEAGKLLTAECRKRLDMFFSFDHLEMPGKSRFDDYVYDAAFFKSYYSRWMERYAGDCRMSLFYDNHDNPRMLSKIDPSGRHRDKLAKLLGVLQFTLLGTPFVYQGQELGAVNADFDGIGEMRDVESLNLYSELARTMPKDQAFKKVLSASRDHGRVPMQWDDSEHGGFTAVQPWIKATRDGFDANAQSQDPGSILNFYKKLSRLRKNNEALIYGDIEILKTEKQVFAYIRRGEADKYCIVLNLCCEPRKLPAVRQHGKLVLTNYDSVNSKLLAYEARVYKV